MAQDGPKQRATWYVETQDGLEGPHGLDALRSLALEGKIPLASRVMDAESNTWTTVAALFKDLNTGLNLSDNGFVPPPRPADLRQKKAAPLVRAENIDYLKMISAKPTSAGLTESTSAKRPRMMERTREVLRHTLNRDSMQFRFALTGLGALSLMILGTYGLLRLKEESSPRTPAGTAPTAATPAAAATAPPPAPRAVQAATEMPSAMGDAIGSGQNPVNRNLGASNENAPHMAEQVPPPPPPPAAPPPQQAEVQHYDPSTFDQVNSPVTPPEDPNRGVASDPTQNPQSPMFPSADAPPTTEVQPTEMQQPAPGVDGGQQ